MEETTNYEAHQPKMFELADRLKELKDQKKEAERIVKEINAEIEQVNEELSQIMVAEEMQNFSRAGSLFYLSTKTFASPVKGQHEELYNWLKQNGYGDLVKETVHHQSLTAFIKEMLEEEEELPEDLQDKVNVHEKTIVGVRKG